MMSKPKNDLAIFGAFFYLQEFVKHRGLTFETSGFDFRDLLKKLFHMKNNFFYFIKLVKIVTCKPLLNYLFNFRNEKQALLSQSFCSKISIFSLRMGNPSLFLATFS